MGASGTIGSTITYARKGGTAYARQRVIPHNPKTDGQTGNRAMWKFLSQNWAAIPQVTKDTWAALAASLSGQNFNAYMHFNQDAWKQFAAPRQTYPTGAAAGIGTLTSNTATAQVGQVSGVTKLSTANQNWGIMVFRSAVTGFTTAPANAKLIVLLDTTNFTTWIDTPVVAGTWYYNFRVFAKEGLLGAELGEQTVIVT